MMMMMKMMMVTVTLQTPPRSVNDSRMAQFFKNDFNEDRWRKAALKNAFKLIGLQKFQCAAAFFLLGGAVKDAVEVGMLRLICGSSTFCCWL